VFAAVFSVALPEAAFQAEPWRVGAAHLLAGVEVEPPVVFLFSVAVFPEIWPAAVPQAASVASVFAFPSTSIGAAIRSEPLPGTSFCLVMESVSGVRGDLFC